MTMYVVTYTTESGDTGVAGVFAEAPTEGHYAAIAVRDFPEEVIEEDGETYKRVYFETQMVAEVSPLPDPIAPIDGP